MLSFLFRNKENRLDNWGHVGRLRAFGALRDLELNGLSLLQGFKAFRLDRGVMHEHVRTGLPGDEAVALGVVEPLHGSLFPHLSNLLFQQKPPPPGAYTPFGHANTTVSPQAEGFGAVPCLRGYERT